MKNKRGQIQSPPVTPVQPTTTPTATKTTTATPTQTTVPVAKKSKLPIWIASGVVAIVAIVILIYFLFM